MDRTSWFVVILCALGFGLHVLVRSQMPPPPASTNPPPITSSAVPGAEAGEQADPDGQTSSAAQTADAEIPETTAVLKNSHAEFHFTNRGGGLKKVVILGKGDHHEFDTTLNQRGVVPIGTLSVGSGDPFINVSEKLVSHDEKSVVFEGTWSNGAAYRKKYELTQGEGSDPYLLAVTLTLTNHSDTPLVQDSLYWYVGVSSELTANEIAPPAFFWNNGGDSQYHDTNWFSGGWFSSPKHEYADTHQKLRFAGVMNRFYTSFFHLKRGPNTLDQMGKVWAKRFPYYFEENGVPVGKEHYAVHGGMSLPGGQLAPKETKEFAYELYVGPKEYTRLAGLGEQRRQIMFYGVFSPISRLMMNIMGFFHNLVNNWGVAIILMTILIRSIMWPLHAKSTRLSRRMSLLAPKIKDLKDKYPDEPQKVSMETMALYRDYGINPLGGCLPALLQIPIFFAFFSVLRYAAELHGESFLWIKDLSNPDTVAHIGFLGNLPLNPLPLLMTVTMFIQMSMMPKTGDPMQRRIFMFMPFAFLIFCYNYASALALYWTVQNLFSIGQTWLLYRGEPPALTKVPKKEPGKFAKMMEAARVEAERRQKELKEAQQGKGKSGRK